MSRDVFRSLLVKHKQLSGQLQRAREQWRLDILAARKHNAPAWAWPLLTKPIDDVWLQLEDSLRPEINWIEYQLRVLARVTPPLPGEEWLIYERFTIYRYSTQTNPRAYTEGSAKLAALELQAHGLTSRVRQVDKSVLTFLVEVQVSEPLDLEILRRAPSPLTFRDWLKACLQMGLNPRVFAPLLPWDTETRLGLDAFGRDL